MLAGIGFASRGSFSPWLGLCWKSQKRAKGCQDVSLPTTCLLSIGCKTLNWILCCWLQNGREAIIQSEESTEQDH